MANRQVKVVHTADEHGTKIVKVDVFGKGRYQQVIMNEADFDEILSLGISPKFSYNINVNPHVLVRGTAKGVNSYVSLARIILDADKGQSVRCLNDNKLDLRRCNLVLVDNKAGSKYRARSRVVPIPSYELPELIDIVEGKQDNKTIVDLATRSTNEEALFNC